MSRMHHQRLETGVHQRRCKAELVPWPHLDHVGILAPHEDLAAVADLLYVPGPDASEGTAAGQSAALGKRGHFAQI